jgi:hypothetical protein
VCCLDGISGNHSGHPQNTHLTCLLWGLKGILRAFVSVLEGAERRIRGPYRPKMLVISEKIALIFVLYPRCSTEGELGGEDSTLRKLRL